VLIALSFTAVSAIAAAREITAIVAGIIAIAVA